MTVQQSQIPDAIYLQNYESFEQICQYNSETGLYSEIPKQGHGEFEISGTYIKVHDTLIGLFASNDGPILFKGHERYLLKNGTFKFYLKDISNSRGAFGLVLNGSDLFKLEYDKPQYDDGNWSAEVDIDFFQWLQKLSMQEDFQSIFTIGKV